MNNLTNPESNLSFEDFKHQNGITYWWASDFALMLGYQDLNSFKSAINRATKAFLSLGIEHYDNIIPQERTIDNETFRDFKLTRFACYIIAMNADPKKPEVAMAQSYFAVQTRKYEEAVAQNEKVERLIMRDEIKEGNKSLAAAAHEHNVEDYARFTNAGYRGMYNMLNVQLANRRGVSKDKLFETMGRTELAANLFRITQTEEKIRTQNIQGQQALEGAHYTVGRAVRDLVIKNTRKAPENLPQTEPLSKAKKSIKQEFKEIKKIDK